MSSVNPSLAQCPLMAFFMGGGPQLRIILDSLGAPNLSVIISGVT